METSTGMQSLPDHVLVLILRHCNEKDLAKLVCTSRTFRAPVEELELWRKLSEKRWPLGDVTIYKGNWRAYFASRMALPASLPSNIDQAVLLTQQASQSVAGQVMTASVQQGQVRDLFARFMQAVLSVGLLLEVAPAARKSKEVSVRFNAAVCNWLEAQPQVAISYVQDMVQTLQQQGPRCMGEAAWRRSALAFLMRAAQHAAHASILSRLQAELATFDVCLKKAQSNDSHMSAPIGVPKSHWWYQQAAKAQQVVS